MQLTELVTKFSFKGSLAPLSKFRTGLQSAIKNIAKAGAVLGAVKGGIDAFVVATLAGADAQQQLAKETGVSIENLQELGYVASVSGSSTQALEATMKSLSSKIGDAAQKGSEEFSRLGISVRDSNGHVKKADQVLNEVGKRFKQLGLSMQEQKSFASSLGIDSSLLQMLNKSGTEINALKAKAKALGVVTEEQSNKIIAFNDSFTTLKYGMSAIQKQLAIGLSPAIKSGADSFTDFLVVNKKLVGQGIKKVVEVISTAFKAIKRLAMFFYQIIDATIGWKTALILLGMILALTLSPIYLIVAGIVAVLAVIDDLIVAFQGGKSVIADFFQTFLGIDIKPILDAIVATFKQTVEQIKQLGLDVYAFFKGIWDAIVALFKGDFSGAFGGLKKAGQAVVDILKNIFGGLFKMIFDKFKGVTKIFNKIKGLLHLGSSEKETNSDQMKKKEIPTSDFNVLGRGQKPSLQGLTPLSQSNNNQVSNKQIKQDIKIEIKTDNPELAGKSVHDSLQEQLFNADSQLATNGI